MQAVEDIRKGRINPGSQLKQLQVLQQGHNKKLQVGCYCKIYSVIVVHYLCFVDQFLDMARALPDYCSITFPHAACDARKQGHVITSVNFNHLKLQACDEEGVAQVQHKYITSTSSTM